VPNHHGSLVTRHKWATRRTQNTKQHQKQYFTVTITKQQAEKGKEQWATITHSTVINHAKHATQTPTLAHAKNAASAGNPKPTAHT